MLLYITIAILRQQDSYRGVHALTLRYSWISSSSEGSSRPTKYVTLLFVALGAGTTYCSMRARYATPPGAPRWSSH